MKNKMSFSEREGVQRKAAGRMRYGSSVLVSSSQHEQ
jgi:hypothetical protein